ncbi:MAG: FAD-dependent monooxygenase [Pseudomonadota bacterium]
MDRTDIAIAGGGIAGLTAACRFGAEGLRVDVVDPAPADATTIDRRTTAFLQPAIETLQRAGAWSAMAEGGAAMDVMRIVDAGGRVRQPRETADFTGAETAFGSFGVNIPNTLARQALIERLAEMPNVSLHQGRAVTGLLARSEHVVLTLSDEQRLAARLAVAVDGRDSTLRQLARVGRQRWEYGQKALVFTVSMDQPHDHISTEIHRTGGPLTLVPMPDHAGAPAASIVWLMPARRADDLADLDDAALSTELTAETMGLFGRLRVSSPRGVFPIISQVAHRLRAERVALVAEAAHVMPPIGAQGLNTSLSDIEHLAKLVQGSDDPGSDRVLARYEARQMPLILAKVAGIDALNRAVLTESQPLRDIRALGLAAVNRIAPLRRFAIKAGMGG